jgi:protein-tyrosine-phosphatase
LPVNDMSRSKDKPSILFVCCGNRERSVIAENLLRQRLQDKHPQLSDKVDIGSAGIIPRAYLEHAKEHGIVFEYPYFEKGPNTYAIEYLAQKGIDISSYRSRQLNNNMVAEAGLILAVDRRIRDEILQIYPESSGRIFTFKEFAFGSYQSDLDIGDSMKLPGIDQKTGAWIWPDEYPVSYISDIEQCLSSSMDRFREYIQGKKPIEGL